MAPYPSERGRRTSRLGGVAVLAGLAGLVLPAAPVVAAPPSVGYEMPFGCAEQWTGTTRRSHSPSERAVDWNRPGDLGRPVTAAAAGRVTTAHARARGGYGKWVVVDHGNGESSLYAHLKSVRVQVGQTIDQGEMIGTVGATGNTSGAHLHFERKLAGKVVRPWFAGARFVYGSTLSSTNCVDVPLAGSFAGDRAAELVVFRRGASASFVVQRPGQADQVLAMGRSIDRPLLGDWDGDGFVNPGLRKGKGKAFVLRTPAGTRKITYGNRKDRPVAGDWDGDGSWEIGVHRAATGSFLLRRADGSTQVVRLGAVHHLPVTGDWNGDGITDVGVFDPATATYSLQAVGLTGGPWPATVAFGQPGDLPVVGDWDGNGTTDLGAWTPGTAVFSQRRADAPHVAPRRVVTAPFGRPRR